ncbi:MAG TPA: DUF4129 domain-containing protein [Pseudonocardiaceae bacterium]|nr:DUF4129 domain-containing protein [Pseudonocardiaceae bacterium]
MIIRRVPETVLFLVTVGALLLVLASAAGTSAVDFGEGWVMGNEWALDDSRRVCTPEEAAMNPPPAHCPYESETSTVIGSIAAVGLSLLLLVVLLLLLFSIVVTIGAIRFRWLRWRRRRFSVPSDAVDATAEDPLRPVRAAMRQAVRRALAELRRRTGGDPGDAVVAAWVVLEQTAAEAGCARAAHQTPTEFAASVLASHDVDTGALDRLRALYQRARFGTDVVVTEADVAAATEALETLVDELAGSRV